LHDFFPFPPEFPWFVPDGKIDRLPSDIPFDPFFPLIR